MAQEVTGPGEELTTVVLLNNMSTYLLIYIHRLVLFSTPWPEASLCCGQQILQRLIYNCQSAENKRLWVLSPKWDVSINTPQSLGNIPEEGWKDYNSLIIGECCEMLSVGHNMPSVPMNSPVAKITCIRSSQHQSTFQQAALTRASGLLTNTHIWEKENEKENIKRGGGHVWGYLGEVDMIKWIIYT